MVRCPKCGKLMKTDCENEKYICDEIKCGKEIKWSKTKDLNNSDI